MNNLALYLKELEKEQMRPKISRRKKIIKISYGGRWWQSRWELSPLAHTPNRDI